MVTKEFIEDAIERHKRSGLSVKDFCFNEGIRRSTFYYWLKKIREKEQSKKFIPIITRDPSELPVNGTSPEIRKTNPLSSKTRDDALLEVVYPNGTILRVRQNIDISLLHALVNLVNR